jgi:hypothetical protein
MSLIETTGNKYVRCMEINTKVYWTEANHVSVLAVKTKRVIILYF